MTGSPTVAVIQARTGSTRLPGKTMYPLAGGTVIERVLTRTDQATHVDQTLLATSVQDRDTVLVEEADRLGYEVVRGDEVDVLSRYVEAAGQESEGTIIRVCGDNPLIAAEVVDAVVDPVRTGDADYAANVAPRSFPRGLEVEAFSAASLRSVDEEAVSDTDREHVTPFYRRHPDRFTLATVTSAEVFEESAYHDRTDLRFTLDTPADYKLIREVYERLGEDPPVRRAIDLVTESGLAEMNAHIEQKEADDVG